MKTLKIVSLFTLFVLALSACSNDDKEAAPEPEPDFVQIDDYTKKYKNGMVEVTYAPVDITTERPALQYVYYDFDKMAFVKPADPKTEAWDITFTSRRTTTFAPYGVICAHNSTITDTRAPWTTGTDAFNVTGSYIPKSFDEVETVPDDLKYSFDKAAGYITGVGAYDDPSYIDTNISGFYVNSTETGLALYYVPYANKCYIIKLNDGRLVKFEFTNIYKNKPADNNKDSEKGYLSFRYYVAKPGSKDVKTK
ncbi:HmuY family protein [Flavobacterium procerum]|uniref:HmuY family protein n=1 Tax=Flavobacterium procerum TaxID=1455569 RepID=A0ABV6BUB6_9FLAO